MSIKYEASGEKIEAISTSVNASKVSLGVESVNSCTDELAQDSPDRFTETGEEIENETLNKFNKPVHPEKNSIIVLGEIGHGQFRIGVERAPRQLLAFSTEYGSFEGVSENMQIVEPTYKSLECSTKIIDLDVMSPKEGDKTLENLLLRGSFSRLDAKVRQEYVFKREEDGNVFAADIVGPHNNALFEGIWTCGSKSIANGIIPKILTIGGDHSLAIGSVSACAMLAASLVAGQTKDKVFPDNDDLDGSSEPSDQSLESFSKRHKIMAMPVLPFSNPELVVFWIDAHADINTPLITESGKIHGCPLSLLTGVNNSDWDCVREHFCWYDQRVSEFNDIFNSNSKKSKGSLPFVNPAKLVYIGLRDVDAAEEVVIQENSILIYRMEDVVKRGGDVTAIVKESLKLVDPEGVRPIHCSFDIDSIDPKYAGSTGTPVPNGLLVDQGINIIKSLGATGRLFSMDLVEVNTLLGTEEDVANTLDAAARIISTFTQIP